MDQPLSILSVSSYQSLLQTREWILKQAGFNVTSAYNFSEAMTHCRNRAFDVVIIDDSLLLEQKQALINEVRKHRHTRIFSLFMRGDAPLPGVDCTLEALLGPEKLIEEIHASLKKKSTPRDPGVEGYRSNRVKAKRHSA